jgi:ankyrin repeat protein
VTPDDPTTAFLAAALWHGVLAPAETILGSHPEVATATIHAAAVLGDDATVRRLLAADPSSVRAKRPPYEGDALNYLGLSKYLRLDRARTGGFVRAATALLDAGADPNTGFWHDGEFETALYGAAGVAHHEELTRLLLERGADPNDEEVVYHSPETRDNAAMRLVVETGRVTPDNLSMMLIRKHDWHDLEGVRYLLERGADPNHQRSRGWSAIHHAIARDNALAIVELLLDHGADPTSEKDGMTAIARAARWGRSDVLDALERRGTPLGLAGVDRLIAACARGEAAAVRSMASREPTLVDEVLDLSGRLLGRFALTGNPAGVRQLLNLGVEVRTPWDEGDGYFGIPPNSLAIHVAAWCCQTEVVKVLIERGSPVDLPDANGRTPVALALRACVDSYWTESCSPQLVEALITAGASANAVPYPCGHAAMDAVLARHRP